MPAVPTDAELAAFADELRKWWAFDNRQCHTHTWRTREDFIRDKLPDLLTAALSEAWRGKIVRKCERPWGGEPVACGCACKCCKRPLPPAPASE